MLPRMPLWLLVGRPRPGWRPAPLPPGTSVARMAIGPGGAFEPSVQAEFDDLDRQVAGFAHPDDHAFLRREGRLGWTCRDRAGSLAGYGYVAPSGRIAPIAVRDPALLAPLTGYLLDAHVPPGASAVWAPGASDAVFGTLIEAGLRLEGFPLLLAWTRPFADFSRYLPISPGLL
jgi:hypothetical protein